MYPRTPGDGTFDESTATTGPAAAAESTAPELAAPVNGAKASSTHIPASPNFPVIEREILAFWKRDATFDASIARREGAPEWVFYDGPPFANGLPHYGHLLTGYAKDVFPRFQTMRGKQVHRRFGWDTHGLPAELEAERQLGLTDKSQIETMGLAAFNTAARDSVLKYTKEWERYVTRQARWVDFENDYKTLDITFMESVIWAFKSLYDKGFAYEGYRVLPYCWRDQTPLSNHELRMDDDVYKMRQDQAVTVAFPLTGEAAEHAGLLGVSALAWTTTPWTLPTNFALAVGPNIEYVVVPVGPVTTPERLIPGTEYLLAAARLVGYAKELGYESPAAATAAVTRTLRGSELTSIRYEPVFDYYCNNEGLENAWRILAADYVTAEDGTGIVHQAPAYGEEDQKIGDAAGIPVIVSLDEGGRFLPEVTDVAGQLWFEANKPLTQLIRQKARLIRQASFEHSYPHCWRCRNPLIYRAVTSWFVRVTQIRDRMVELNQQITWVPENVKNGQFGTWLQGARDWSISRNRYWGSPIPVWKSDDPEHPRIDVYGSLGELERDFGRLPRNADGEPDLHRPYVDDLTRPNPDDPTGRSTMRRVSDVLDVWFDSGSMPYAQVHYPFENREWFDTHNPADFIVEYIGQTRGWFYMMHVLSTALFDRPAFQSVVSHGIVLGSDGQKMSKSLRNYPDVAEVFDRDGSDAMRWFLMSSSVLRGGNLIVTEEGIREGVRQFLLPLWSTWYFFSLYANTACVGGYTARRRVDSSDVLDRYILAKLHDLVEALTQDLDDCDSPLGAQKLRDFADVLTNWYVRRSRARFWGGVDGAAVPNSDGAAAFDTLYTVLETLCRLAAPMLPLITEKVWQGLTGKRSVHLTDWPEASEFPASPGLVAAMDRVREVSSVALALRKKAGKRVRLPLASLTVVVADVAVLDPFVAILREELNVKTVTIAPLTATSAEEHGVTKRLTVNARAAGPRLGGDVQRVIQAARAGEWHASGDTVTVGGITLLSSEYDLVLEVAEPAGALRPAAGTTGTIAGLGRPTASTAESAAGAARPAAGAVGLLADGGFVLLDTHPSPHLEAEGLARDVVRVVQEARKQAGLEVSDRITLTLTLDPAGAEAAGAFRELIAAETLATTVTVLSEASFTGATVNDRKDRDARRVGESSLVVVTLEAR
ncbi:MAG: isoleucine--tRNA ligase [Candidatus Lumbricidophila eiseniae]|uniref:Isoleucine--tRNA ligase n=1 Tax=Candidatus Lumbricidiphila eiseniae TaxID=1969409 RepID=A0A2A6FP03_9MICO|nr:MAG: isoleucine--tRNA ligase [Candidatus Lumbricidophila eiseniae]